MTTAQSQLYLWRDGHDQNWFLIGTRTDRSVRRDLPDYRYTAILCFHSDQLYELLEYKTMASIHSAKDSDFPMPVALELSLPAKVGAA